MIITLQTLIFFRESLLNALDRILRPYYKKFSLTFGRNGDVSEDEESDEQVFADYDEEKGVVFYPPVYLQRYAAVSDCLLDERWCGKLEKVVDLGYHDMSFIKYLKEVSGIRCILGVDIESIPLRCSSDLMGCDDYGPKRENPLQVTLFQGNAADPDYRLIGCDAVIAIEMIEHMLPQDLDRLIHTVFGFIKPWVAVFSTPNGDFNVLFKSMEKNGFRRWDHFFEWSREQFHDWCSNIVSRYPEYTVTCKGIGPGPPGTLHLGCCSQMAIFVSKDYHKQQDLNLDSLALVANAPSPYDVSELIENWDSAETPAETNMICPPNIDDSYTELYSEKQSCVTILITSPTLSLATLSYQDKTSQCNLDSEAGKNYMMFDYELMCLDVVVPRRKMDNRVYIIEDVTSRLNCTTLQVKKFSKTTQNLIAKNKLDSLVHTREVVDEIRHLTKMLNFNKELPPLQNGTHVWHNINWGDDAPYWNQYYKVVREYNPPYESKSEDSRITDLISDEINRLIDGEFDDEFSSDVNRLEIPIELLMAVVAHITDDVEKVKDLLEWNGYEIVDNVLIHSRLVLDTASASQTTQDDDWQDNDTYSDWDSTDVRSTTLSDGSAMVPDYHARCLRRALDQKVRKLRTMLTADEDITTELDKIVCRLMKLALRTSRGRQSPPPTRWMQCKLLDLLTLTEKSIERRKRHFIDNYPLNSINYGDPSEKSHEMIALAKIREDDTAMKIVDKYRHLVQSEKTGLFEESRAKYRFIDLELVDDLSVTSAEFLKENEYIDRHSPSLYDPEPTLTDIALYPDNENTKLERTQAWLEDDLEMVPYPDHDLAFDNSSGDTDHSMSKLTRYYKKTYRKYKNKKQCIELKCVVCKKSHSRSFGKERKLKDKNSITKVIKRVSRKKSSYSNNNNMRNDADVKSMSVCYRHRTKPLRKEHQSLKPTASKPIPASLIELCHPELMIEDNIETYKEHIINYTRNDHTVHFNQPGSVSATEKSIFIDIVMDDVQETIALRRSIGTDAEEDPMGFEYETLIRSVSNTLINDDHLFENRDVTIENDQTIFLDDINQPSTSKGIRHVSMDVQCGPDNEAPYLIVSRTTSAHKIPSIFNAGIKIVDSLTDTKVNAEFFTTIDDSVYKTVTPRERAIGVTIKESAPNVIEQMECLKITLDNSGPQRDQSKDASPQNDNLPHVVKDADSTTVMQVEEHDQIKTYLADDHCEINSPQVISLGSTNVSKPSTVCHEQMSDQNFASIQYNIYKTTTSKQEIVDIQINESVKNMSKSSDSSTMTHEEDYSTNTTLPQDLSVETNLLKSIPSGMKSADSSSEFCDSVASIPKSAISNATCMSNESQTNEIAVPKKTTKYVRPKLCCGGVQVHSFRDKQTSEDIMYQGEWQNNRPKVLTKRKVYNPVFTKKDSSLKKKVSSKEKILLNTHIKKEVKVEPRKPLQARNLSPTILIKENIRSFTTSSKIKENERSLSPTNKIKENIRNVSPTKKLNENKENTKDRTIKFVPKSAPSVNRPVRTLVKVPSNLTVSSKNKKPALNVKHPPLSAVADDSQKPLIKKYLPYYLRRKSQQPLKNNTRNLNKSVDSAKLLNLKENAPRQQTLIRSKTEEIKRDLLKFQNEVPEANYMVLRNDVENKVCSNDGQLAKQTTANDKRDTIRRSISPQSQNSSTCSSPNSIATVRSFRTKKVTCRRHSITPYKTSSESENTTPDRIQNYAMKSKNAMSDEKRDNKENVPETSRQSSNITSKLPDILNTFMVQKKEVFIAQLKETPPLQSAANKSNKSNVMIPKTGSIINKRSTSPSLSKKSSLKSDDLAENENPISAGTEISNMVLVLEPPTRNDLQHDAMLPISGTSNVGNSRLVAEWMDSSISIEGSQTSNIQHAMRILLEETLDFIDVPYDESNCTIDSETVILGHDYRSNAGADLSSSPVSFRTVITNDDDNMLQTELEHALNRSFETFGDDSSFGLNDTRLTDFDMLSFKSITSVSKHSDYLSADSLQGILQVQPLRATSVKDIYERKDQAFLKVKSNVGAIANQAFSGFSINGEPIVGDIPDPINFVDSETGSMTVDVSRQANSEELLISGRSTDSFESCLVDDDAVVPSWLFQIISQQAAEAEAAAPEPLMLPLQMAEEPLYDANGNVVEGVALGDGAGDGRGIHSDQSQDSSGQGTSLSSSVTSSEASEAILIDPSAFVAQYDGVALEDSTNSSFAVFGINGEESRLGNGQVVSTEQEQSYSRGEARRNPRVPVTTASDVDADVSSLETDVHDSSDN